MDRDINVVWLKIPRSDVILNFKKLFIVKMSNVHERGENNKVSSYINLNNYFYFVNVFTSNTFCTSTAEVF